MTQQSLENTVDQIQNTTIHSRIDFLLSTFPSPTQELSHDINPGSVPVLVLRIPSQQV